MFRDRNEAAQSLAARLQHYRGRDPLVLAIPRGGVPMGRVVADALDGELDVVLVHKLGAPGNPEFAIGAVDETGQLLLNEGVDQLGVDPSYLGREREAQIAVLRHRRALYGGSVVEPEGRIVIVVDDGVATGTTLLAALRMLRQKKPARLIAAVGVAPRTTAMRVAAAVDEWVCLETPAVFFAVSQFFASFPQVSDQEVMAALRTPERI